MDKKALLEQFKAEVETSGTSVNHILKMCEFNEVSNDFSSDTIHDYSVGCLNGAWWMYQRQQAKVEGLQKRVDVLTQTMEELLEEMKYPTATFEEVIVCGVGLLEQALKGGEA
ncbi:hypothetical protein [Acinetobacter baumannii]|uniref:Uncharacterized protein n=1 Tax=Acinetobacter baumannii TaxID=470 RepID=A0A6I4IGT3_ACIBA|nr:hypothetical protein [Acinetobacter baumannii]KQK32590.1 hypothetical protein AQ483_19425 [Acinetobacter baumannii]KQK39758.1 hypothetical protein AQ484_18825 [Acinetobacter baumannii]MDC4028933.1 hypothetical protein [Acinetobacter baumannii]MDC4044923.1 hypothetical protein [Acinetobacter baumannii]MDC4062916.1 hypothetical protein [Acinetobacter baumannii]